VDLVRALVPRLIQDAASTFEMGVDSMMEATMAARQKAPELPARCADAAALHRGAGAGHAARGRPPRNLPRPGAEPPGRAGRAGGGGAGCGIRRATSWGTRRCQDAARRFNDPAFTAQLQASVAGHRRAAYQAEQFRWRAAAGRGARVESDRLAGALLGGGVRPEVLALGIVIAPASPGRCTGCGVCSWTSARDGASGPVTGYRTAAAARLFDAAASLVRRSGPG
jgi:hypothetical protein